MKAQRWFSALWWRAMTWWRGRQLRLLLLGLPALVGGLAVVTLVTEAAVTPPQEIEARYQVQAENALKAKDYSKALTCYDRLAYRSAERPEILFGMAQAAEGLGQIERARTLMAELTPLDRAGYGPAHVWQARQLLNKPTPSAFERRAAESHLLRALDVKGDDDSLVHSLLCDLYTMDGQYEQAEAHLIKAVKTRPQLRLRAAQLYALRGDKPRALQEAELAVVYFRGRANADRTDHLARLGWADATTFLEHFPEALAILDEGFVATRDSVYPTAMARVYATWYDTLSRDPASNMATRLTLLEQGLKHNPANAALLERLLAATKLDGGDGERARATLHGLLASGKAPATVHFALGVDAMQHGQIEQARVHWERAFELSPDMPVVANNLAWMIATAAEPDLPRALALANIAVERAPKELNFRHTRGNILFQMERYKEALGDLEAALPRYADNAELHMKLAITYEHLGVAAMAAEHRRQAKAKPAPKNPGKPQQKSDKKSPKPA